MQAKNDIRGYFDITNVLFLDKISVIIENQCKQDFLLCSRKL